MKLWKHQQDAVDLAKDRDYYAFLMEAGTGKTLATIECLKYKYNIAKQILPTLIVCPLIVIENWADELRRFTKIPHKNIIPLYGPSARRVNVFSKMLANEDGNAIVITNYECIVSSTNFFNLIYNWAPAIMVVDESHKLKSPSSRRTKLITSISKRAHIRYLLTGTPILNSPLDIFSQWRVLDKGATFGENFYTFRAKYFVDINAHMPKQNYFPNWVIRPSSFREISNELAKNSFRAIKSECLDLPPVVTKILKVDLTPKQRKAYDEMKNHFLTYMSEEKGIISADIALTKLLRMLQIVTGFVKTDDDEIITFEDIPRVAALREILEEISPGHKIIIWCVFKENYKQVRKVCEDLEIPYVEAHGEISTTKKFDAVNSFNSDNRVRVFIGHPASLGIGINLVGASYSIRYSRTHNYGDLEQSNARNYRGGSEIHEKITRIEIIAKETIEEQILTALDNKETCSFKILEHIRKGLL